MMRLTEEAVRSAVLGGALLGGGGGGSPEAGERLGTLALEVGVPSLVALDELPDDAILVTVSAVGAPAAAGQLTKPMHYVRAVQLLLQAGVKVDGLVTSENGGLATINGWFQSAALGIPVVDAPCNGRAHPIGLMGSIGLHQLPGYLSRQAAAGGNPDTGRYLEVVVAANLAEAARLIRQAAVSAGGLAAVARNPVAADYARKHAAVGAIQQAMELGRTMREALDQGPQQMVDRACALLGGRVLTRGTVQGVQLQTAGGFDVGKVVVGSGRQVHELTFWNEYMTVESEGERLATFPDLIATVESGTGAVVTTAAIRRDQEVTVLHAPRERLILGAGMKDPALYEQAEKALSRPIVSYVFPGG